MTRKVAVVTGASRGIGKQLAVDLAKDGFDVACLARSSREQPSKLPGHRRGDRRPGARAPDARRSPSRSTCATRTRSPPSRSGSTRAGAAATCSSTTPPSRRRCRALDDTTRRWRLAVDVNLNGPFYFLYHLGRRMREQGGGRAINLSSLAAALPGLRTRELHRHQARASRG